MRHLVTRLSVLLVAVALSGPASAQQPSPDASAQPAAAEDAPSPWLLVPVFSSSPKLGTAVGGLGAYMHVFDPDSRVSLFGVSYRYTSTHSQIASAFARTSFGADHHRIVVIAAFGQIKNDYEDYLGTGQPLKTDDDLKALAARYLFRATGDWFIGGQGSAANYQVLGATAGRRSRARDTGRARLRVGGGGCRADARFTRQRRHAHDRLVLERQQSGLS